MSIESWKAEFYPETAIDVANRGNEIECIEHSIQKWNGLSEENLNAHEVQKNSSLLFDIDDNHQFELDATSCSLCEFTEIRYNDVDEEADFCNHCPIVKATGKECNVQWNQFVYKDNPKPMQELLQQTLEFYKSLN